MFPHERNKLAPRAISCVYLGISPEHRGYRCYDPNTGRVRISRHVQFDESSPYFSPTNHDLSFLLTPSATLVESSPFEFPEI